MNLLSQLSLARPWWLLALLPLAAALWHAHRRPAGTERWRRAIDAHLMPHVLVRLHGTGNGMAALAAAWLLAVVALSGPVLDDAAGRKATRNDSVRVLVVDLSPDAAPRLDRIKLKLLGLLARPGGETALLVYADEPFLVVPPTEDAAVVARFIPELAVDAMPAAGNRPDRAFRMASALLARSNAPVREIVWIAGTDWSGAAAEPVPEGLRISALHAGTADAPGLRALAERTGGILAPMHTDDTDLKQLAAMPSARPRMLQATGGADLGAWLLLPLLPLAALRFRRGLLAVLPLALCAGVLPEPVQAASPAEFEARRLFDAGRYEEAAGRFFDVRWKAAAHYRAGRYDEAARMLEGQQDAVSLYNRANALAKTGRLQEALAGYEASLRLRPADADTLHNRDLVRRLLEGSGSGKGRSGGGAPAEADAARVAEQWLRGVPDDPGSLLRRKLQAEYRLRQSGQAERPW